MKHILNIDIETFSSADLKKSGMYRYALTPDFDILLLSYSLDDGPVITLDLTVEKFPTALTLLLVDPKVKKTAFNAQFERACLSAYLIRDMPAEQWECTMVKAGMLGLPMQLGATAKALGLPVEKDAAGKGLIRYFSIPCKPTKANGMRERNLPEHAPEKWEAYKAYNRKDVEVEKAVRHALGAFEIPKSESAFWALDQKINDRGVQVDVHFVKNAIQLDTEVRELLTAEAIELTGLSNPNSPAQIKSWLANVEPDADFTKLTKDAVKNLLDGGVSDEAATRMLEIRQEMAKSSVKKYVAMANCVCPDRRVRGLLQFYGANRTGRWAGRLVQVQNLPQNHLPDLDLARACVLSADLELLQMLFGNAPDALSQLIRTAFVAKKGSRFIVADFSAIEARVIAWLAGEKWRLDVFKTHGKIYETSASQMFRVPIESVTKGSDLRQRGKVSELALGYQGGPNALVSMGALKMGLAEEELPKLVKMWRNANPAIVRLWADVQECAQAAIETGMRTTLRYGLAFYVKSDALHIQLPSGRSLVYQSPQLTPNRFGDEAISYMGMDQTSKQWCRQETYGGKLVENIVQAIARDLLADAMLRLDAAGLDIVMSVHDEAVLEVPEERDAIKEVCDIMGAPIAWAPGLPLRADAYETKYYKKDRENEHR